MKLLLFVAILSLGSLEAKIAPKRFDHHMVVVANEYDLYWTVKDEEITFQVQVKTLGYVALGISPNGGMAGSDIVTAWVKDDIVYFQDRYATRNALPEIDEDQNWTVIEGVEQEGYTIVTFKRPLVTCDKLHDKDINDETVRLIYAYHPEDPLDAASLPYHGSKTRGAKSVTLVAHGTRKTVHEIPPHTNFYDMLNPSFELPEKETTYWCETFKLPQPKKRSHIVRIEPIIQPGNEGIVHHIVIFACMHEFNETAYLDRRGHCYGNEVGGDDLMGEIKKCTGFMYAWAIGGPALNFPDHVGFPIGEGVMPRVVRMETHYDNPSGQSGIIDNSGVRIYYTEDQREYDAGLLEVGAETRVGLFIPPSYGSLTIRSFCTSECFSRGIPEKEDIKVFGVLLHTHLMGTKIRVRHFRDGKELPLIGKDDHYDFNFQDIRILPEEVVIKPNDNLIVECDYRSAERKSVTFGGLGTREEMCLAFLSYYPKMAFSRCQSSPKPSHLLKVINPTLQFENGEEVTNGKLNDFTITGPSQFAQQGIKDALKMVNWTNEENRMKFQQLLLEDEEIVMWCEDGPENLVVDHIVQTPPDLSDTYVAPEPECTPINLGSSGFIVKASSLLIYLSVLLRTIF